MASRSSFGGFPPESLGFYERLAADNSRAFWQANRKTYDESVREPMEQLCARLENDYGPFHLFRPYNDMRFSKNRPPYKTHQGAYSESEGGAGYYVQISAEGLMCGAGYYGMAKDQLQRFRAAVDADAAGAEIDEITTRLARRFRIGAIDELKTAPRGYPKDHPRIELLRRKGLMASKDFGAPTWLESRRAATEVAQAWQAMRPLCDWLDAHVGPSTLPPEDARR